MDEREDIYTSDSDEHSQFDAPKSNSKAAMIALIAVFILLIGLCIFIAVTIANGVSFVTKKDTEYQTDSEDPWEEILGEDAQKENGAPSSEEDGDVALDEDASIYASIDWEDESWKDIYTNVPADEMKGPYYENPCDSINEDVPYEIKREFEEYTDKEYNICIRVSYIQLAGDIPNLDEINETLKEDAFLYINNYEDRKQEYQDYIKEYAGGMMVTTASYVTYNDAEMISIALKDEADICYVTDVGLYGENINLVTGTFMDNSKILELEESFGQEFRDRSNRQNGVSESAIEPFSNVEIVSMLKDTNSLILFYTPLGIEMGYQYDGDGYSGWITITMRDYEKYLSKV